VTEDELLFAIETIRAELEHAKGKHKQMAIFVENQNKAISKHQTVKKASIEALEHLLASQIVSIGEYRSLMAGLRTTNTQLDNILKRRSESIKTHHQASLDIPKLEAQLADLQRQLERYEPTRVVLEFKKDDKP